VRAGLRAVAVATSAVACTVALAACADRDPAPAAPPVTPAPTSTAVAAVPSPSTTTAKGRPTASATTALPGMPVPLSVGSSPVDPATLRSTNDLPSVFQCPAAVTPIRIPPTLPATGATVPAAPEAVVCASALADKEAVYLWFTPTAEAKLGALTQALATTKYVHGGPNWVAAGMLNPTLGTIGGEVYR
jgi:hypothetical protein